MPNFADVPPGRYGGKQHTFNPYEAGSELSRIWQLGYDEADGDQGRTYDNHPESERSHAYDLGRDQGQKEGR